MRLRKEIEGGFAPTHDTRHDGEHIPEAIYDYVGDGWEGTALFRRCQHRIREGGPRCLRQAVEGSRMCSGHFTAGG